MLNRRDWLRSASAAAVSLSSGAGAGPGPESELIFPLEHWHNHASCLVELPDGDLLACWYHGSGERTADDVLIEGARLRRGAREWSPRFPLADTPGFPDCNPAMLVDSRRRLWLLWPVILANRWETALMKYRVSVPDPREDPPRWEVNETMLFVPRNFEAKTRRAVEPYLTGPHAEGAKRLLERASDKYFSRLGWMPRAHAVQLPSGRILVPLYSDGYSFSLIAISDDFGGHWTTSEPLVGFGSIQPALARRKDGTLVAYMRDNGPPPKRIATSFSQDDGVTWSAVADTELPNPGAGIDVVVLRDGSWVLIYNDTERGRNSLAVSLSEDEGQSWRWTRHLELDRGEHPGAYHYPSIIQTRDGMLHATYSYFLGRGPGEPERKSIKHARFQVGWIKDE